MGVLLRFRSSYRGECHYQVLSGALKGKLVSVRYLNPEWYQKDYDDNVGRVFGNDPANYRREVMQAVGLVCCPGHVVEDEIVVEINGIYSPLQRQHPDLYYQGIFLPGQYIAGVGWTIDVDRPPLEAVNIASS